jgi:hypothetical protein
MMMMENVSEGLCHGVCRVNGAPDVFKDYISLFHQVLQCKVLDIDVTAATSRAAGVSHHNRRSMVFKQNSGFELQEAKLNEDSSEIFCNLGGANDSHKFAFIRAETNGCSPLGSIHHSSSGQAEDMCSDRPASAKEVCMRDIQLATNFIYSAWCGHHMVELIHGAQVSRFNAWKVRTRGGAPINQAVLLRLAEVSEHSF